MLAAAHARQRQFTGYAVDRWLLHKGCVWRACVEALARLAPQHALSLSYHLHHRALQHLRVNGTDHWDAVAFELENEIWLAIEMSKIGRPRRGRLTVLPVTQIPVSILNSLRSPDLVKLKIALGAQNAIVREQHRIQTEDR